MAAVDYATQQYLLKRLGILPEGQEAEPSRGLASVVMPELAPGAAGTIRQQEAVEQADSKESDKDQTRVQAVRIPDPNSPEGKLFSDAQLEHQMLGQTYLDELQRNRELIEKYASAGPQLDLSALMGAGDILTGGKYGLQKNYKAPDPTRDENYLRLKLQDGVLDNARQAYTGYTAMRDLLHTLPSKVDDLRAHQSDTANTSKGTVADKPPPAAASSTASEDRQAKEFRKVTEFVPYITSKVDEIKKVLPTLKNIKDMTFLEKVERMGRMGATAVTGDDSFLTQNDRRLEQLKAAVTSLDTYLKTGKQANIQEFNRMRQITGGFKFSSKEAIEDGLNDLITEMSSLTKGAEIAFPKAAKRFLGSGIESKTIEGMKFKVPKGKTPTLTSEEDFMKMTPEEQEAYLKANGGGN